MTYFETVLLNFGLNFPQGRSELVDGFERQGVPLLLVGEGDEGGMVGFEFQGNVGVEIS